MHIHGVLVTPRLLSVIWRKLEGQIGNLLTRYFWGKLVIKLFNLSQPPFLPHLHVDIFLSLLTGCPFSLSLYPFISPTCRNTHKHTLAPISFIISFPSLVEVSLLGRIMSPLILLVEPKLHEILKWIKPKVKKSKLLSQFLL